MDMSVPTTTKPSSPSTTTFIPSVQNFILSRIEIEPICLDLFSISFEFILPYSLSNWGNN
ncbi:hypothetical protein BLOT_012478 [Blomia tropicalis]|nr:hypothetical protein BLOT_012478 [Blomia tropicalis]